MADYIPDEYYKYSSDESAGAARRRELKKRRSRRRWRGFLAVYSVLFLALGAAGCYLLYRYAAVYETSLPEHVMDEVMANTDEDEWFRYARGGTGPEVTAFESADKLLDVYFDTVLRGRDITYRKDAKAYTEEAPVYTVRCGGKSLCTVTLEPIGHKAAGFGRNLWKLGSISSCFTMDGLESVAVEIDAPVGTPVFVNGVAVGDEWLTGEDIPCPELTELESRFTVQPRYERRRVEPLYGEITVTDESGAALSPAETGEEGVVRCTVAPRELYTVTVRAPKGALVNIGGADIRSEEAEGEELGVLEGLDAYTGGEVEPSLRYSFAGLYTMPEVTAQFEGQSLTPLMNEKGELIFFLPEDEELKAQQEETVRSFFDCYINYSSKAYDEGRYNTLLSRILPGTELYSYVRDSVDAMIWASATEVHYDELSFEDFRTVGEDCFTCTIRYKADFAATAWYESYTYDLQNAYELAFVRSGDYWYAAAMAAIAG